MPLVNQFGVMQQQMFDQFQQAMAMMLQMFGTMHREQMEVIRGELDQLHDLTEEFHLLRNELANRTPKKVALVANLSDTASEAEELMATKPTAPVTTGASEAHEQAEASSRQWPALANQPFIVAIDKPRTPIVIRKPRRAFTATSTESICANVSDRRHAGACRSSRGRKPMVQPRPTDPERDSIAWLHQRIMTLQRERETRWQKILKLLPGISS